MMMKDKFKGKNLRLAIKCSTLTIIATFLAIIDKTLAIITSSLAINSILMAIITRPRRITTPTTEQKNTQSGQYPN